jgi:hypothetical protein
MQYPRTTGIATEEHLYSAEAVSAKPRSREKTSQVFHHRSIWEVGVPA